MKYIRITANFYNKLERKRYEDMGLEGEDPQLEGFIILPVTQSDLILESYIEDDKVKPGKIVVRSFNSATIIDKGWSEMLKIINHFFNESEKTVLNLANFKVAHPEYHPFVEGTVVSDLPNGELGVIDEERLRNFGISIGPDGEFRYEQ